MFIDFYEWDQQNGLQLNRKLTREHIYPNSQLKMRNHLAEDVLNLDMLHALKTYQHAIGAKGEVLNGVIELLEQTSQLVQIFRDRRPIKDKSDSRLHQLKRINDWFTQWEEDIDRDEKISSKEKAKCLMSKQCHEDIHACLVGFLELCELVFNMKTPLHVVPALINSDVIENIFNQQRTTYNGANNNPNAMQYKKTINSIIIGQTKISKKANAARTSVSLPFPIAAKRPTLKRKLPQPFTNSNIRVVRM